MQYPDYDATADIEVINSNTKKLVQNAEEQDEAIKGKEPKIIRTDVPENNSQKVFSALGALNLKNWLVTNYTTLMNNIRDSLDTKINTKENTFSKKTGFNLDKTDSISSSSSILLATAKAVKTAYDKGVEAYNKAISNLSKLENLERKCMYRVGDILTTENKEHPALTWQGTTWKKIEAAFLRGTESGQEAGIISGSNTVTLKIGNLPPHNHPISVILGNSGIHRHKVDNHIHSNVKHKHSLGANVVTETGSGAIGGVGSHGNIFITETQLGGGENTGGSSPYTDSQGNHNHTVTASSSNVGSGEAINVLPRYYTVHYWKRAS